MTADYELLGPAEKEIAKQIRAAIEASITAAKKLIDSLEEIDLDTIDDVLLDSKGKEGAIAIVAPLQALARNLSQAELSCLLAAIFLKPREPKSEVAS